MAVPRAFVRWSGYRGIKGQFAAEAQEALGATLDTLGDQLLTLARREAPIARPGSTEPGTAPGRLRRELRVLVTRAGPSGRVTLDSPTPYARWVLAGRPEIQPVSRKFLRFWVEGHLVFAKHVAGVPPNPYLERAFEAWWPQAQAPIGQLVTRLAALLVEE